ncbi:MAG: hypothetical protein QOK15_2824 [Nocardioidaceae bacterium]|jgi:uncharacterized protein YndB with AHSA1/START domain|nr:hypothetical protein [Nocardioidaceae bacterium]
MATYTVERTRTIDTPLERVYPLIADFTQWTRWSPWEDLDPDLHRAYSGPDSGPGAVYAWSGNRKAGAGRMEIASVEENQRVDIDLDFEKPFRSHARTSFLLRGAGDRTEVTWRMTGDKPLLMRLMGPLMSMDKFVGKDMDKGLDRMALVAPPG